MGELLPGRWPGRESDEVRWLEELLRAIEEHPPELLVVQRTVTVSIDVLARPEELSRTCGVDQD